MVRWHERAAGRAWAVARHPPVLPAARRARVGGGAADKSGQRDVAHRAVSGGRRVRPVASLAATSSESRTQLRSDQQAADSNLDMDVDLGGIYAHAHSEARP